jgi:hypothetical protein
VKNSTNGHGAANSSQSHHPGEGRDPVCAYENKQIKQELDPGLRRDDGKSACLAASVCARHGHVASA